MPIVYLNKTCLKYTEIVPVYMNAHSFKWYQRNGVIQTVRRACRGYEALYDFNSLPFEIRETYKAREGNPEAKGKKSYFESMVTPDMEAVKYYTDYRLEDGRELPEEVRREYIINAEVLGATIRTLKSRIQMQRALNNVKKGTKRDLLTEVIGLKKRIGHTLPDNLDRLSKKINDFSKQGYACLISGKWLNQNRRIVTDELVGLFESLFTQSDKPTYKEAARQFTAFLDGYITVVNTETGEVYEPKNYRRVSDRTIHDYLSSWESKVATFDLRSGDMNSYKRQFITPHWFERPKYSGSVISIDDRQPPFKATTGKKRPWFYMGIDLHSECYIAWVYGPYEDKNTEFVMRFYREIVRNCNAWGVKIPHEVECEASLNAHLKGGILANGTLFQAVTIHQNSPNSKAIERYFRELRYGFDKQKPGFISRPFARAEAYQKGAAPDMTVPYENIIDGCLTDIETWNNMPHSKYPKRTRFEVWLEDQNPNLTATNWRILLPYLGYCTETSVKAGQVRLNNEYYLLGDDKGISTGDKLIAYLTAAEGKPVNAYWLDDHEGNIIAAIITDANGNFYSHLHLKPRYNKAAIEMTPDDHAARRFMQEYDDTIVSFAKKKKSGIVQIATIGSAPVTLNNKFQIKRKATNAVERDPAISMVMPEPIDDAPMVKSDSQPSFLSIF